MRKPHKAVHAECPNGATTWAACDQTQKEARGRCVAMTGKAEECTNWAVEEHEGKPYCGQHYESRVNATIAAVRAAKKRAEMDGRIERFLAWSEDHPSVWDRVPDGWSPAEESNPVTILTTGGQHPRRQAWKASSGLPFIR